MAGGRGLNGPATRRIARPFLSEDKASTNGRMNNYDKLMFINYCNKIPSVK